MKIVRRRYLISVYMCSKISILSPAICSLYTFSEGACKDVRTNERIYELHRSYPVGTRNGVKNGRMTEVEIERRERRERERQRQRQTETKTDRDTERERERERKRERERI